MSEVTYVVESLINESLSKHCCILESSTDYCGYLVIEEIDSEKDNRAVLYPIKNESNTLPEGMTDKCAHYKCLKEMSLILKKYNCIIKAEDDGYYLEPVATDYKPCIIFHSKFESHIFLDNGQFEKA